MYSHLDRGSTRRILTTLLLALAVLIPASLKGQNGGGGTIQGTVTDQSGAVIPGAKLTAADVNTGVVTEVTTTSAGYYVLPSLIPGVYNVLIEKEGFQDYLQQNIQVNAMQVFGLNVKLTVGSKSEVVTVSSAPPALQTENASMTTAVENETYTALPLNMGGQQRDPTAFASLTPGYASGGRSGIYNGAGGSSSYMAEMYLDGIPITSPAVQGDNRQLSLALSVDAVDQFQVTTSGANAGQSGGGSQNYNIKHGTNVFHGTLYDYIRNTAFDNWDFFSKVSSIPDVKATKPPEHQNELGLTIGGPIKKDKIFIFLSGEVYRYTAVSNPGQMTVPTQAQRDGDFSASSLTYSIYDPTSINKATSNYKVSQFNGIKNGVPVPNVIPSSMISGVAKQLQQFLPLPTNPNAATNNYLSSHNVGASNYEITMRTDWTLTQKHRISILGNVGKKGFLGYDYGSNTVLPLPYINASRTTEPTQTGVFEHTWMATPNLINQFKFGYVRWDTPVINPTYKLSKYAATTMGIGNLPQGQSSDTFPAVTFSGGQFTYAAWSSPTGYRQTDNSYLIHNDLTWIHGKHQITAGFDYQMLENNSTNFDTASSPLSLTFNNTATGNFSGSGNALVSNTGNAYASFLLGAVGSTSITTQNYRALGSRFHPFSPYIQDDWKFTPRLTLNLGFRYDLFPPFKEVHNKWSFMSPTLQNPITGNYGAIMFAGYGKGSCNCETPIHTYHKNFAPRVGFAYAMNDKTVIRGSFGISYSHGGGVGGRSGATNGTGQTGITAYTPFASSENNEQPAFYLNSNLGTLGSSNIPAYALAPTYSAGANAGNYLATDGTYPTPGNVSYADPINSARAPMIENWNIGVQRAVTKDLTVSISYVGTESHHLSSSSNNGDGYHYNYLDPSYLVIGKYLNNLPGKPDTSTGMTYLADAQARFPGIGLPYPSYGGLSGSIGQMLRPFPQYGTVSNTWGNVYDANYHGLQIVANQRAWHGLSYTANFTWNKTMDNTGTYRAGYIIPGNVITGGKTVDVRKLEHSISTIDRPVSLKFYGAYTLPFGKNGEFGSKNSVVRPLVSNWQVSWIYSVAAGTPLAVTGASATCKTFGQGTCMPSYNPNFTGKIHPHGKYGNGYLANMDNAPRYINPEAFMAPAGYTIGNLRRTAPYGLRGPHTSNIDMGIVRTFDVWKEKNLKFIFRAEAFNVTNHTEFSAPAVSYTCATGSDYGLGSKVCSPADTDSDTFGRVSSQKNDSRDWQFSGKFSF